MPTDRQQRIEQLIQDDADQARAQGYESTAKVHEQPAGGQQQDDGQADG